MAAFLPLGSRGLGGERMASGDTGLVPDLFSSNLTTSGTTLVASSLITGVLYRSGPAGTFTDTFDTAANIISALAGNGNFPDVAQGMSFKLRIINQAGNAETLTLGAGMVAGLGTIASVAGNAWRDFLFTFLSVQPPVSNVAVTTNGSAVVTWYLAPGQTAELQGPSVLAVNIMPGATVTGTNIPSGTTVLGITEGQGGTLGITLSANATGSGTVVLSFGPTLQVNSSGSGTI